MTPEQIAKHEFLLLMGELGEDTAMLLHLDECPEWYTDKLNLTYMCTTWRGVTEIELTKNAEAGTMKKFIRARTLQTLIQGKDVINDLIVELSKEKSDEKAENIEDTPTG
jgi:hypothetical protein